MMNQLVAAKQGKITQVMKAVARSEGVNAQELCNNIAEGKAVILANNRHKKFTPKGVGKGLSVKVNANLGTSPERIDIDEELKKLQNACEAGADAIMDLSTGGDLNEIRRLIIDNAGLPIGTVPIYQAVVETVKKRKTITKLDP